MTNSDQPIRLDTEEQIGRAGGYVLTLRYALEEGYALSEDDQRRVVAIAEAALLRLKPSQPASWVDTSAGPVPSWLKEQQERTGR